MWLPPNEAATATDPAALPAAPATAANPLAPITGTRVPKVGAKAPKPAAIAGAAKPVHEQNKGNKITTTSSPMSTPHNHIPTSLCIL